MSYVLSSLLLAGPLVAQSEEVREQVSLLESTTDKFELVFSGEEPEPEYNCDEVHFVDRDLTLLLQVPAGATADLRSDLRVLGKSVVEEAVLRARGAMNSLYVGGYLGGVEVDWYFPSGGLPPTPYRLGVVAELLDLPVAGGTLRALLYAYDPLQYQARVGFLTGAVGHPPDQYEVWAAPVLTSTGTLQRDLVLFGSGNRVVGDLASADDVWLWGAQEVLGDVSCLRTLYQQLEPSVVETTGVWGFAPPGPAPLTEAQARQAALASGLWLPGAANLAAADLPPAGSVVFAEGDLCVNASALEGSWTFASGAGKVQFQGDDNRLRPALGRTVLISYRSGVSLLGNRNLVQGESRAPLGWWMLSGNANVLTGAHCGNGMVVLGSANHLSDGTLLESQP